MCDSATASRRVTPASSLVKTTILFALVFATLFPDAPVGQAQQSARNRRIVVLDGREVVEGEVIVRYRSEAGTIERERAEFQAASDTSERVGRRGARRLRSRHSTTRQMLAALRANPDVEFAEPNYIIRAHAVPNDPSLHLQWGLINTGQPVDGQGGVPGADIGAAAAWDITTGSRANIVAILDTGIDFSHPDLAANVFTAPRQFQVTIDSVTVTCQPGSHGYNALNNSCAPFDDNGHGTHVAGIIGAVGNNNIGISGVNWVANLMPLKILDSNGTGTTTDAIKAIEFAIQAKTALGADGNIRVLNASWGGAAYSQALEAEIQAANNADMLFVAAAGSEGTNNDVAPHYPASYTSGNVVSVAAVNNSGALESFSNYGATSVHLAAPGGSTWSTLPADSYGNLGGTSMSAPHVSGAAALVLSRCSLNTAALKAALLNNVDPAPSLTGKTVSGGRLDVERALHVCPDNPAPSITAISPSSIGAGVPSFTLTVNGNGFTTSSQVRIDGSPRVTRFVSATQVEATIPASDVASSGSRSISIVNPLPGGGSSGTLTLSVLSGVSLQVNGTTGALSVAPGASLTIAVANGPANIYDWVTFSPVGSSDTTYAGIWFLSGTSTPPATGRSTATFAIPAPTTPGTYEVRFLASGYFQRLATSGVITVGGGGTPSAPTLTVNGSTGALSVAPGASLTIAVANGPANIYDWVTFSPVGSSDTTYAGIWFLSGTSTPPATGRSTATFAIPAPTTPGTYEVRFLASGYFQRLATSGVITVGGGGTPSAPTLTVNGSTGALSVAPGASLTIAVANGPANIYDWVTFSPVGSSDTTYAGIWFLSGTSTPPATGRSTATFAIPAPTTPGTYEVRFLASGYFQRLATSGVITVGGGGTPSAPTLTVNGSTGALSVAPGASLTIAVANGPANIYDWVTFSPVGSSDTTYAGIWFLSGTSTPPATGRSTATFAIPAPTTPGTYEVRFLASGYFQRLATSGVITVGGGGTPSAPTLTVNGSTGALSVAPGASLTIAVANGPANIYDWVTFSPVGSSDTTYAGIWFLSGTSTPPATGRSTATFAIPAPTTPGTYEVRFLASGYFQRLATSGVITVSP